MTTEKNQKIANGAQDWWEIGVKDGGRGLRLQLYVFCILVFHAVEEYFWKSNYSSFLRYRLVRIGAEYST